MKGKKIFLLGGQEGVAYAAGKRIKALNQTINIVGASVGFINIKEKTYKW